MSSTAWLILFGGCALIVLGVVAIVRAFTFGKPVAGNVAAVGRAWLEA